MLDPTDVRLLAELQRDATLTSSELGDRLALSLSQAARRRQRLEAEGYIRGYSARLDPGRLGLGVQAFVHVHMAAHSPESARGFASLLGTLPEVTGAWTLTGEADYLLRVWCPDLKSLARLIQQALLPHPSVSKVHSQIVLDELRPDSGLPVSPGAG